METATLYISPWEMKGILNGCLKLVNGVESRSAKETWKVGHTTGIMECTPIALVMRPRMCHWGDMLSPR
jgi:hypothetical protein